MVAKNQEWSLKAKNGREKPRMVAMVAKNWEWS